jgi:ribose 5-phosphate isomerase B
MRGIGPGVIAILNHKQEMRVYFAADHGGFALKEKLKPFVESLGYEVEDCGAPTLDMKDDYPPIIQAGARKVAEDPGSRGIIIGGSGQGEAFAANRIKGVRAVVYYGEPARTQVDADGRALDMISSTREHNDSNILSLAGRFLTEDEAKDAVQRWLAAPFDRSSRHQRRHELVDEGV